nr:uncharacterized protein LOC128685030 [Cherax quadricarinatus]
MTNVLNTTQMFLTGSRCVFVIQAPTCLSPQLTFNNFSLYGYDPYCDNNYCCYFDFLEIRTTNLTTGDVYCDMDIMPSQVFTSPQNTMILFFSTTTNFYTGWSANVSFIPIPGCTYIIHHHTTPTTATTPTTTTTSTTTTFTKPTTTTTPSTTTTINTQTTTTTSTAPTTTTTKPSSATSPTTPTTPTTTTKPFTTITTTKPTSATTTTKPTITNTTTKPTTTTTTIPTKTTIATTTTAPSLPRCNINTSGGCFVWTSPFYGIRNYTDNFSCSVTAQSRLVSVLQGAPYGVIITADTFMLARVDYVSVNLPYNRTKTYTSTSSWTLSSPSFNFNMLFVADSKYNNRGFSITICPVQNSCHVLVNTTLAGNTNFFTTPGFLSSQLHSSLTQCEWWIVVSHFNLTSVTWYFLSLH